MGAYTVPLRAFFALLACGLVVDGCAHESDPRSGELTSPGGTEASGSGGAGGEPSGGRGITIRPAGAGGVGPCSAREAGGAGEGGLAEGGSGGGGSGAEECVPVSDVSASNELSIALCGCVADSRRRDIVCFPLPTAGESCDAAYSSECVLSQYRCGITTRGREIVCSGVASPGAVEGAVCCFVVLGDCIYPVG